MLTVKRACTVILILLVVMNAAPVLAQNGPSGGVERYRQGHSAHGKEFDTGPRQKPWRIEGVGKTHFPITTSNPEAQVWFDQGNSLLHSFWYYEAERAFRWALKLDPDCAMAYWGLAQADGDDERGSKFIKEAAKRKHKVSERERLYIEAWEALYPTDMPKEAGGNDSAYDARRRKHRHLLEQIVMKYPDDLEAKAYFALGGMGGQNRLGTEAILQQIIARDPNHPGAHHYRIHNWDGKDGRHAIDSCALYGRLAPGIGHAQHMPGHIYSGIGMWHEAAISMDAATRVEQRYMRERLVFPFNTWNYAHNQNYLSYIQEQLGMADAAISGARKLLAAPLDPKHNNPGEYSAHWQGMLALMRGLVKFERWREILDPKSFYWQDSVRDKMYRAYVEAHAHLGLGDVAKAAQSFAVLDALKKDVDKPDNKWLEETYSIQVQELKSLLMIARGEVITGLTMLGDVAKRELEMREARNDPPSHPNVLYNTLGRAYLAHKSPSLAAAAFEKTLELVRNDGFALAGLVEAYSAAGEKEKARDSYARLLHVWGDADANLKWMSQARALGLEAKPKDLSPGAQRNYKQTTLDQFGPGGWESYPAPVLEARDARGERVTLDQYRGKNVLMIFYLGEECPHCMLQLREVAKRKAELAGLDVEVLAISSAPPEKNAASSEMGNLGFRLLSDAGHENARRFKSFDDFEEIELHSTILIDKNGRVHWARTGGDPYMDFDFLVKELRRINGAPTPSQATTPDAAPAKGNL